MYSKYGVEHALCNNDILSKSKQTKLKKYGNENFNNLNKNPSECYYKTLNCSPSSNPEDIKKEYYRLAKKYHPDNINSNSKENQNVILF